MKFIAKFLCNTTFKRFCILTVLLIIYMCFSALSYTNAVCSDISEGVFRLHVIANSNSNDDQNLKFIVRDSIINYIHTISKGANSKDEIIEIAQNNLKEIENIACQTVLANGFNYPVKVEIGNFPFPSKKYGDITLPPGYYDALKVKIGEASGENWWCVMFPPLCFVDVSSGIVPDNSKKILKNNLEDEEYSLISESSTDIKVKFKIVEVLQNFAISGIFI